MIEQSRKSDKTCRQCGTCCRKGGPAIHDKDKDLLKDGMLRLEDLITFRIGEFVRDESQQKLVPLEQEVVKIAPVKNAKEHEWTCRFLITQNKNTACAIYKKHPAECRALFCKNPELLLALPADGRQTRTQLLEVMNAPKWYNELIESHNENVDLGKIAEYITIIESDEAARIKILEAISFDSSFRELAKEKGGIQEDLHLFLFGRPLLQLMYQFKIQVLHGENGLILKKI